MPLDARVGQQRIAIVGGGIAGLSAALMLHEQAEVTLFEAEARLGGHARTVVAGRRGDQPVDTGFIVFNHATYPHLGRLFRELEVAVERSDMSFAASLDGGRIEYALSDVRALLAQPRNALSPAFLAMLRDILRFNRGAEAAVREGQTIDGLVTALGLGESFRRLLPEAVLRRDLVDARSGGRRLSGDAARGLPAQPRPARAERPAPVVDGQRRQPGLRRPPRRDAWPPAGCASAPAPRCGRSFGTGRRRRDRLRRRRARGLRPGGARLPFRPGPAPSRRADRGRAQASRRDPLSRRTAPSCIADAGQMPRRRACWSSWVCRSGRGCRRRRLGHLLDEPPAEPAGGRSALRHPEPDDPDPGGAGLRRDDVRPPGLRRGTAGAQAGIAAIQGENRTWYAGAWLRNGFHEDGIASAMRVARAMGVPAW